MIVLTEYDARQAFLDYAWEVSDDRLNWRTVYDTRRADRSRKYRIDEVTTAYDLDRSDTFRYVRLTFRAAEGLNRLLVRNIKILSRDSGYRAATQGMDASTP